MSLAQALRHFAAQRAAWRVPVDLAQRATWFAARRVFGPRHFELAGRRYPYLVHPYVLDNERAVEVPIALAALDDAIESARLKNGRLRVLEVGHVLSAYADLRRRPSADGEPIVQEHVIVDKYEKAAGVLNVDIVDYRPDRPFDLVLSVSTLEHVGRDEEPRDDDKALRAFSQLRTLLAPGGTGLVSFPVGYHPRLDAAAKDGALGDVELTYLERCDRLWNRWREAEVDRVLIRRYGDSFPCANGLVIVGFGAN